MQDRVVLSRDAHGVCMCCSVLCAHGYVGFVPEPQLYVDELVGAADHALEVMGRMITFVVYLRESNVIVRY